MESMIPYIPRDNHGWRQGAGQGSWADQGRIPEGLPVIRGGQVGIGASFL